MENNNNDILMETVDLTAHETYGSNIGCLLIGTFVGVAATLAITKGKGLIDKIKEKKKKDKKVEKAVDITDFKESK